MPKTAKQNTVPYGAVPALPVPKDYIAAVFFEGGAGSWFRDTTPDKAVAGCKRIVKSDWGTLLKTPAHIKVCLFDVTGHDTVSIGERGVWAGKVNIPLMETHAVTINTKRKR